MEAYGLVLLGLDTSIFLHVTGLYRMAQSFVYVKTPSCIVCTQLPLVDHPKNIQSKVCCCDKFHCMDDMDARFAPCFRRQGGPLVVSMDSCNILLCFLELASSVQQVHFYLDLICLLFFSGTPSAEIKYQKLLLRKDCVYKFCCV